MRLITRSDFDGLGCATLLKELGMINAIKFVHPKEVQNKETIVNQNDILANMPYDEKCAYWFDHHSSEGLRIKDMEFKGKWDPSMKSATDIIYQYFGGTEKFANPLISEMVQAVNKADSAEYAGEEILNPTGWTLLAFIIDPRTGLARYKDYRITHQALMLELVEYCRTKTIDEILSINDVQERVLRYLEQQKQFIKMIRENVRIHKNIIILDLRNQDEIFTGNRFIIYSLFPEQNLSVRMMWDKNHENVIFSCGHSIINPTSQIDIGSLMLKYRGGGHKKVGSCQVGLCDAQKVLGELIKSMEE